MNMFSRRRRTFHTADHSATELYQLMQQQIALEKEEKRKAALPPTQAELDALAPIPVEMADRIAKEIVAIDCIRQTAKMRERHSSPTSEAVVELPEGCEWLIFDISTETM